MDNRDKNRRSSRSFGRTSNAGQVRKNNVISSKGDTSPKQRTSSGGNHTGHHTNNKSISRSEKRNVIIRNEVQDLSPNSNSKKGNNTSSKKVNMNHLLGVSFQPRDLKQSALTTTNYQPFSQQNLTPKRPRIDYVRTHCQTLFRKSSPACPSLKEIDTDPNLHVNWSDAIAGLRYFEQQECAICLDQPLAPRATPCGHVYCYPCMLHHFSVINDDNIRKSSAWHKCPVCHKEVLKRKLKPARITIPEMVNKKLKTREKISFKLVNREKSSVFGRLSSDVELENNKSLDLIESPFGWVDLDFELEGLYEDLELLNVGIALAESSEEPFFKEAMELIESEIAGIKEKPGNEGLENEKFQVSTKVQETQVVQYYQASNARMFLHPINNRCMLDHFDGKDLPNTLTGNIVDVDTFQIYPDLVKRFKFLSHLPSGTTVHLVELDVKSMCTDDQPVQFSQEVLKKIKPAIAKRRKHRHRRAHDEKLYEQRLLEEEMEHLFVFDESEYHELKQFPEDETWYPEESEPSPTNGPTLAQQLKQPPAVASFGFAARMRDGNGNTLGGYEVNRSNPSYSDLIGIQDRSNTPPSCAQIVYKTKKSKKSRSKNKK